MAARNPAWTYDELILALDLYFRFPPSQVSQSHPEVTQLSEVLKQLPVHVDRPDPERFRNPNGVYMKLCSFLRLDPSYSGTGLRAGGKKEEEVWNRFADNRNRLREVAEAIKSGVQSPTEAEVITREIDEEEEAPEGRVLFRQHRSRERNQSLVRKRKALALKRDGRLMCEVCGFVFEQRYGSLKEGFIEAHHMIPLSKLRPGQRTKVKDIALVCANCHRMLHRGGETLTVSQLKQIVNPRA